MKASELRIGNVVKRRSNGDILFVDIELLSNIQRQPLFFKPMPLTEEWLLRFGFKLSVGWFCLDAFSPGHPSQRFDLYWSDIDGFMMKSRYQMDSPDFKMRHIKYVHQLQNLYFALTGEELTIKNQ